MKPRKPTDQRAAAKRSALNALRRARRAADRTGVELSDWEGEFLGSVEQRVETYGRAFGDPEKGSPGQALSALQSVKLKEIVAKAKKKGAVEEVVAVLEDGEDGGDDETPPDPSPQSPPKRSHFLRRGFGR